MMKFNNPFKKLNIGQNKTTQKGAGSPQLHIVICKLMNDRTPVEVLEFDASQVKDENFNMNIINEDLKFKEELDKKKHHILEHLYYKMELADISREEKVKKVDKKIKSIEADLISCKKGKIIVKNPEGQEQKDSKGNFITKNVNKIDLEIDLRHFKVLRYTIENDGDGSYEIINKNGQRELRFLARDGILHPYFYRSDSDKGTPLTMYADIGLSRKYYKEIDEKIEQRYLDQQNNNNFFAGVKGLIVTILICALVLSGIVWNVRNYENAKELDAKLDVCRAKCVETADNCGYYYSKLIATELINRSVDPALPTKPDKKPTSSVSDLSGKILGT